ncbi:MAG: FIST C-terminal domain-containing protein [Pseudohongiella sp.]|nr:FIST C-terminal domain-containing protein [Pseudohongiella sp.]
MKSPHFTSDGSLESLQLLLQNMLDRGNPDGIVILGCVENDIDEDCADQFFRRIEIPVAGGLFPALIHDQHVRETGWLVYAVQGQLSVSYRSNISQNTSNPGINRQALAVAVDTDADIRLVIVDGHSTSISSYLTDVYSTSNVTSKFIGGGAGSLANATQRCIISNNGLARDAAIVVQVASEAGVGVSHGWRAASSVLRATSTSGSTVQELNFRPALEVYSEIIESEFNTTIDPSDLIATASMFPLGIRRIGGSTVVRDPIASTDTGGLICVGEFDENCFVYVLTSNMTELLESTASATRQADADLIGQAEHKVVFDCISRFLLMKDQFDAELTMLSSGGVSVTGVLSIGEIASSSDGFLEFYNKTTAIVAFPGD